MFVYAATINVKTPFAKIIRDCNDVSQKFRKRMANIWNAMDWTSLEELYPEQRRRPYEVYK